MKRRTTGSEARRQRAVGAPLALELSVPSRADAASAVSAAARLGIDLRIVDGAPELLIGAGDTLARALRVQACLAAPSIDRVGSALPQGLTELLEEAHGRSVALLRATGDGRVSLLLKNAAPIDLGEPGEARQVLLRRTMLREATALGRTAPSLPADAEHKAREVLFGPARTLSDPSSRKALEAYGGPSTPHRLAETATRAAAHARALGAPVDLRIASPDLSALDHPSLAALDLRTPGEVREAQRALLRDARALRGDARILGVTVAAHAEAALRVRVSSTLALRLVHPLAHKLAPPFEGPLPRTIGAALALLAQSAGRDALFGRGLAELLSRLGQIVSTLDSIATVEVDLALDPQPAMVAARLVVR